MPKSLLWGFEIKYKSSRLEFMKVKKSEDYGVNLKILIREICGGTRVTIQKQKFKLFKQISKEVWWMSLANPEITTYLSVKTRAQR